MLAVQISAFFHADQIVAVQPGSVAAGQREKRWQYILETGYPFVDTRPADKLPPAGDDERILAEPSYGSDFLTIL